MSNIIIRDLSYLDKESLNNVVAYTLKIDKSDLDCPWSSSYWYGSGVLINTPRTAIHTFEFVKRLYNKKEGSFKTYPMSRTR